MTACTQPQRHQKKRGRNHAAAPYHLNKQRIGRVFREGKKQHPKPKEYDINFFNDMIVQHFIGGDNLKRHITFNSKFEQQFNDGANFTGQLVEGEKVKGKLTTSTGVVYEGEFIDNLLNGDGKVTFPNGNVYEGCWQLGKFRHCFKVCYHDGNMYEGPLEDFKKSGYGVFTWKNGQRYEGMWKNGAMQGTGILYREGRRLVGEWHHNQLISIIKDELSAGQ